MGFFRKCSKFRRSIPLKNATKSFEMTLNTKHGETKKQNKTKQKKNRQRNKKKMKNQNTQRQKLSFTKRTGKECRLIEIRTEKNNDHKHKRTMHKIQFRSTFKGTFFYRTTSVAES